MVAFRRKVLFFSYMPSSRPGFHGAVRACCLGLYHQAINDSSKSCKVNSRAYLEDRCPAVWQHAIRRGGHCVGKWKHLSLITQRNTSPRRRDKMGTR